MKTMALILGVLAGSLPCLAQSSFTNKAERNGFFICTDGEPRCKIMIWDVGPHTGYSAEPQSLWVSDGRRLQRYFNLLSGCHIPIQNVDPIPNGQSMPYTIEMDVRAPDLIRGSALVYFHKGTLTVRDTERRFIYEARGPGQVERVELPRTAYRKVLDEFGQKCFGVPVSAVDDPNYKWPEKKSTLVIDTDKFEPIVYPPKKPERPK